MTDKSQNSGVRNLRAMFESQNSNTNSPEPRGRSPASKLNDEPIRPTSNKVRASFVSVEPSGIAPRELGTTKGTADGINSTSANRRESFSISEDRGNEAVAELKKAVSEEKEARKRSVETVEAVPEQAVETRESSRAPPPICPADGTMPNLGSIMKGADFAETPKKNQSKADAPVAPPPTSDAGADALVEKMAAVSLKEKPADNPDKIVTGAQEEVSLKPADPKDEATVSGGEALPPPAEVLPSANITQETPEVVPSEKEAPKAEEPQAETSVAESSKPEAPKGEASTPAKAKVNGATSTPKTNGSAPTKKPPAISTTKAAAAKGPSTKSPLPKSPGVARLPKTPTTPKTTVPAPRTKPPVAKEQPKPTAPKEPSTAPISKPSRTSLRASTTTSSTATASKAKAPVTDNKKPAPKPATSSSAPKTTSTSPSGFKKPRPKSPTRPIRLSSHLTAPTTASAAKHGEEAQQSVTRKPSTISRPAPPKAAPAAARKQPSRASLAPSTAPAKRPESRTSTRGGAEEGFLARMMRPTASSASKTHDKPASPPRRGASLKAPNKAKPGHESVITKGKKKVGEAASKAKEALHNGHDTEPHSTTEELSPSNGAAVETTEGHAEPARESTPSEQLESSAVQIQTPNFEEQAIR